MRQNTSKSQNDLIEYSETHKESQIENKKIFNSIGSTESMEIQVDNNFQFNNAKDKRH